MVSPASVSSSGQWWLFPASGSNVNDIEERRRGVAGVQTAWQVGTGTAAPVVAILDTGITSHPDLASAVLLVGSGTSGSTTKPTTAAPSWRARSTLDCMARCDSSLPSTGTKSLRNMVVSWFVVVPAL